MSVNFIKKYFIYSTKELTNINLFWWGITIYFAAHAITKSNQVNFIFFQMVMLIGIGIFLFYGFFLIKFKFESEYHKILFILLIFWASVTVVRGIDIHDEEIWDEIKKMLFNPWFGMFPYFVPLVMLLSHKLIFVKKAANVLVILSLFYVLYCFLFYDLLNDPDPFNELSREAVEFFSKNLSVPIGFILFLYTYYSKKKLFFSLFILLFTIFFALLRGRRGLILMVIELFVLWYLLYFIQVKRKSVIIIVTSITLFASAVVFAYLFNSGFFETYFEVMAQRGTDDTRSGVEQYFFMDMQLIDYVVGRGMNGEYYCPTLDEGNYRDIMETDYLNIILKGGSIYLALILGLLIPAVYKGLFQSRNLLSKAAAFWILFWMVNLYPSTVKAFNMTYILVWISAGICYSKEIRNIPDKALTVFFHHSGLFWKRKIKS